MSRLAANSLRARDRRARRMLAKKVGALSNKRIIVNVRPVFEALLDPRIAQNSVSYWRSRLRQRRAG